MERKKQVITHLMNYYEMHEQQVDAIHNETLNLFHTLSIANGFQFINDNRWKDNFVAYYLRDGQREFR